MATLAVLADAASRATQFVDVFVWVYILLIFAYVLTSRVRLPYSPWVRRISEFLRDVCEPYPRLFRRIIPPSPLSADAAHPGAELVEALSVDGTEEAA